jgi:hypothetical protein
MLARRTTTRGFLARKIPFLVILLLPTITSFIAALSMPSFRAQSIIHYGRDQVITFSTEQDNTVIDEDSGVTTEQQQQIKPAVICPDCNLCDGSGRYGHGKTF